MNYQTSGTRKKKKRNRKSGLWLRYGIVALLSAMLTLALQGILHMTAEDMEEKDGVVFKNILIQDEMDTQAASESSADAEWQEALQEEAKALLLDHPTLLMLVNAEHACEEDKMPVLRTICNGRLQAADDMYADLCDMLEAASEQGHSFWIASAYRSKERQQELIDQYVIDNMRKGMTREEALEEVMKESMPAGYSEHQTGLALDVLASSNTTMDREQENTQENQWLQEHCYEYGFVIRYPENKEDITGISYEPWHIRYVGKEAAAFMQENDLCLEELWELAG